MKKRLLVICGPTATGKTALALHLSKIFNGELISADSRQVYKYMDIGTGKDRGDGNIKIWGYDLVRPDQDFSVKNYVDFAYVAIRKIYKEKKLPILVGGTGLYIKAVVDGLDRIYIPRDINLRKKLATKTANQLFAMIMKKNPAEASRLNDSDKKNPRRLIRILEILSNENLQNEASPYSIKFDDVLWVGLNLPKDELYRRIDQRIDQRINADFEKEKEFLKRKGFWNSAPSQTIGYKDGNWRQDEKAYAKRQLTWFKKEKRINWFDITDKKFKTDIENLVRKWYKLSNEPKD
jgi:tRNA dimethylallyltransferase